MPGGDTTYGLTQRQADLLRFVSFYIEESGGLSPSLDECAEAIGLNAESRVHYLLNGLEERGHIRRVHGKARGIELVRRAAASRTPDGAPLYFIPASAFAGRRPGDAKTALRATDDTRSFHASGNIIGGQQDHV